MDLGIKGRKAIVNGASAGMGKHAALALARAGVDLCICARGEARLMATAEELAALGVAVTPIVADHSTAAGRDAILAACPVPDILVGTCSPPPMTPDYRAITMEQWRSALDISLLSPVQFIHAVTDGMCQRGWGRIVNIATVAAKYPLELRALSDLGDRSEASGKSRPDFRVFEVHSGVYVPKKTRKYGPILRRRSRSVLSPTASWSRYFASVRRATLPGCVMADCRNRTLVKYPGQDFRAASVKRRP
jgi:NAD(P)-dependent dehydrogenase (short-subunit alcohol dehydrogenase family)